MNVQSSTASETTAELYQCTLYALHVQHMEAIAHLSVA